jgi:hypothetical protein
VLTCLAAGILPFLFLWLFYLILRYCSNSENTHGNLIRTVITETVAISSVSLIVFSYYLIQVRSIFLRGFDQQLAEMVGEHMTEHGMKFIRPCVPTKVEKVSDGKPGVYKVLSNLFSGVEKLN